MFIRKKEQEVTRERIEALERRVEVMEKLLDDAAEMTRKEQDLLQQMDNLYNYSGKPQVE